MVDKKSKIRVKLDKIMFYPPSKGYAILLKELQGKRQLPIIVGVYEAQAIALGLEKLKMPRPLTHDLFARFIKDQGLELKEVIVNDLIDGTFYANILMNHREKQKLFAVDSRPSDAIALAIRLGGNIFVAEKVMKSAGQVASTAKSKIDRSTSELPEKENLDRLFELQMKLQAAIDKENYELAAQLRDEINSLEDSGQSQKKG